MDPHDRLGGRRSTDGAYCNTVEEVMTPFEKRDRPFLIGVAVIVLLVLLVSYLISG